MYGWDRNHKNWGERLFRQETESYARILGSTLWMTEIDIRLVFPVPDCAWAITSRPASLMLLIIHLTLLIFTAICWTQGQWMHLTISLVMLLSWRLSANEEIQIQGTPTSNRGRRHAGQQYCHLNAYLNDTKLRKQLCNESHLQWWARSLSVELLRASQIQTGRCLWEAEASGPCPQTWQEVWHPWKSRTVLHPRSPALPDLLPLLHPHLACIETQDLREGPLNKTLTHDTQHYSHFNSCSHLLEHKASKSAEWRKRIRCTETHDRSMRTVH